MTGKGERGTGNGKTAVAAGFLALTALAGFLFAHVGAGMAVDGEGRVLFIDNARNTLWRMEPDGELTVVARDAHGDALTVLDDGTLLYPREEPASAFSLRDPDGSVYRIRGNRVDRVDSNGAVTTIAGDAAPGFLDGPGSAARFRRPLRLSLDSAGNIYVADYGNHRIRKVGPDGTVSTVALVSWPWWPTAVAAWRDRVYVLERWGDYYRMPPVGAYLSNLIGQPRISIVANDGTIRVVARVASWPARLVTAVVMLALIALVAWRLRRALARLRSPA